MLLIYILQQMARAIPAPKKEEISAEITGIEVTE